MELQLILIKTALLAEKKGCDLELYHKDEWTYFEDGDEFVCNFDPRNEHPDAKQKIVCNQELLRKYLRDNHNIHIEIPNNASGYMWVLNKAGNVKEGDISGGTFLMDYNCNGDNDAGQWDSYEEALEVALYNALKIIKL